MKAFIIQNKKEFLFVNSNYLNNYYNNTHFDRINIHYPLIIYNQSYYPNRKQTGYKNEPGWDFFDVDFINLIKDEYEYEIIHVNQLIRKLKLEKIEK
jgi:hypothetical protein